MNCSTIAITNQKGGVAKTTTCVNLAASFTAMHRKTLLIDLDPQGNATMGSGVDKTQLTISSNEVLLQTEPVESAIVSTAFKYDILPAHHRLTVAEIRLLKENHREYRLQRILQPIRHHYDFILIDCPPSLNTLTINALMASDSALIPVQCEYYSLEGITDLIATLEQLKPIHPHLHIEGILRVMYDGRNRLTLEVSSQLIRYFGDQVYQTIIPRNVRLAEAPSHGLPVMYYDRNCQGSAAYLALAAEIIHHRKRLVETS